MAQYEGSCHCGEVCFLYETDLRVSEWSVRACQCSFCRKHGACCTSDPFGTVSFTMGADNHADWYRFGLQTADVLVCGKCGVYLGAVITTDAGRFATLNSRAMVEPLRDLPAASPISYEQESFEQRITRRTRVWTPVVSDS